MSSENNNCNNHHDQKVGKLAVMFPVKLHFILSKDNPAIAWSSDGTAVRVLDKELLVKEYLNLYFDRKLLINLQRFYLILFSIVFLYRANL